jgi:hypothetical protein
MSPLLPLLLGALAVPAQAAVYKCAGDKGGVVYQDSACAPGKELGNFDFDPARVNVMPSTPPPVAPAPAATRPSRTASGPVTGRGNAAQRRNLQIGMTEAEVLMQVGRPDVERKGNAKSGPHWTYLPTTGDPATVTTLTFVGGKVANVERKLSP